MSYLTHFWTSDSETPGCLEFADLEGGHGAFLSAGGWSVPILWTMCFAGSDVNVLESPVDEDDDPDVSRWGASCDTRLANAIERVERRLASLNRILAPNLHTVGDLFLAKLRESSRSHVHLELSLLLENEEEPGDGQWKRYWAKLVDGLDEPVSRVRSGIAARLMGLGLPPGWKFLCSWALSNQSVRAIRLPTLPMYHLTGADLRELCTWRS